MGGKHRLMAPFFVWDLLFLHHDCNGREHLSAVSDCLMLRILRGSHPLNRCAERGNSLGVMFHFTYLFLKGPKALHKGGGGKYMREEQYSVHEDNRSATVYQEK